MRELMKAVLLAGLLPACGGAGADDTCGQPVDGQRLKAPYLVGEDGSKEFLDFRWYDAQLDIGCAFVTAADGVRRCLPDGVSTFAYEFWFADAACTQPVVPWSGGSSVGSLSCNDSPLYATRGQGFTCGGSLRVHALEPGSTHDTFFEKIPDGSCVAINAPGGYAYAVGPEVDPATFVAGSTEPRGGRVPAIYDVGEDGASRSQRRSYDSTVDAYCAAGYAADGNVRCLPFAGGSNTFADAACSQLVVDATVNSCDPAVGALITKLEIDPGLACGNYRQRVYATKPSKSVPATIYSGTPGTDTCYGTPNTESREYYLMDAEIPAETFARAELKTVSCGPLRTSGTRLQARHFVTEAGEKLFYSGLQGTMSDTWYDSKLGMNCLFMPAVDGVMRCVPWPGGVGPHALFLDAACTQAVSAANVPCQTFEPMPRYTALVESTDVCVPGDWLKHTAFRVFALGAKLTGPLYQRYDNLDPPACYPFNAGSEAVYRLGAEVAPAEMVGATFHPGG